MITREKANDFMKLETRSYQPTYKDMGSRNACECMSYKEVAISHPPKIPSTELKMVSTGIIMPILM